MRPFVAFLFVTAAFAGCFGGSERPLDSSLGDDADDVPTLPDELEMEGAEVVSYTKTSVTWRWESELGPGTEAGAPVGVDATVSTPFDIPHLHRVAIAATLTWEDQPSNALRIVVAAKGSGTLCQAIGNVDRYQAACATSVHPGESGLNGTARVDGLIAATPQTRFTVMLTLSSTAPGPSPNATVDHVTEVAWQGKRAAPHPAYGFPTLNDPMHGVGGAVPVWWDPPEHRPLPEVPVALVHEAATHDGVERGLGIAVFGRIAAVPGLLEPATLWDLGDPTEPQRLADLPGPGGQDAAILAYPDGRLVLVLAVNTPTLWLWDITDPTDPAFLSAVETNISVHNTAVVPGTPIVYTTDIVRAPGRPTEIYDLSDPENPEFVASWDTGYSCHDITFHIDEEAELYRAYCAGYEVTQIWDIEDPMRPETVVEIPVPHGVPGTPTAGAAGGIISHLAMVDHDATTLMVGDESFATAAPACDAYVEAGGMTASGPLGNLWFYDITDERSPRLVGWLSPGAHLIDNPPHDDRSPATSALPGPAGCTSHFGRLVADTGLLVLGYQKAGVLLIDISDPANPRIVDQWADNTYTMDVWYYQGYMVTGDYDRGMDIFTLDGGAGGEDSVQ